MRCFDFSTSLGPGSGRAGSIISALKVDHVHGSEPNGKVRYAGVRENV
jgi:hypothetical protein